MTRRPIKHRIALVAAAAATVVASGTAVATPAQAATHCVNYQYGYGGYSKCIGTIQKLLNFEGIGPKSTHNHPVHGAKLAVDNSYGPSTRATVIGVQRYWGLKADGVVGPKTWKTLCSPHEGGGNPPRVPKSFPLSAARAAGCNI